MAETATTPREALPATGGKLPQVPTRNPPKWVAMAGVLLLVMVVQTALGFGVLAGKAWSGAHIGVGLLLDGLIVANFFVALRPRLMQKAALEYRRDLEHAPEAVRRRKGLG